VRRNRLLMAGAAVVSVVIVAAWFPASALYHQHQQLGASTAQLTELRQQDKALDQERKSLASPAEIARIARQQYDLVKPGQQAYEVLPPSDGSGSNAPDAGDPGLSAPVTPSGESELPDGSSHSSSGAAGTGPSGSADSSGGGGSEGGSTGKAGSGSTKGSTDGGGSTPSSVGGRILQTLEFWR
jgi:cell division protein FtsB